MTADTPSREGMGKRAVAHIMRWGGSQSAGAMMVAFAEAEIARIAAEPADDGVRELMAATEPFALLAPLVEFTDHRDGERVHEQRDPTTGKYTTLYREDFRRLKRAYDSLSTKAPKP